jgi:16S rRNA processing protein RimM
MSQECPFDELVTIGRVVKPQGRKGELLVHPLSDHPGRFPALRRAYVAGPGGGSRAISVTHCWPHKGRFVLKLSGVDSISEAEAFRGLDIRIPEDELPELPEGAYYHHQLLGLRVEEHAGRPVGVVAQVLETGADAPVLMVRGERGEILIPMAQDFVRRVDLEQGRMLVTVPELV